MGPTFFIYFCYIATFFSCHKTPELANDVCFKVKNTFLYKHIFIQHVHNQTIATVKYKSFIFMAFASLLIEKKLVFNLYINSLSFKLSAQVIKSNVADSM